MAARHSGYYVVLAEDIREDDAEQVINAITMIKGVLTVVPKTTDYIEDALARQRRDRLWLDELQGLSARMRERE